MQKSKDGPTNKPQPKLEQIHPADLIPYARNAKKHDPEQVAKLAGSIREFGFNNPVLIDQSNGIIAGHGRVMAALKLGLESVPVIRLSHLSETQRRAYILADNKLAELGGGWDEEMLKVELEAIKESDLDHLLTGFSDEEIDELTGASDQSNNAYSTKIKGLVYEIIGDKPNLVQMVDSSKTTTLIQEIESAEIDDEARQLLLAAANRHTVFDYGNIAEYYAHAPSVVQRLMEKSALIVVDMDSAIENGYVKMTKTIEEIQQRAQNG